MKKKSLFLAISYLLTLSALPCELLADAPSAFGVRKKRDKTSSQVKLIESLSEDIEEDNTPDLVREIREAYEEELLKILAPFKEREKQEKQKSLETLDTGIALCSSKMRIEDAETLLAFKQDFYSILSIEEIESYPKDIQIFIKITQKKFSALEIQKQAATQKLNKKYVKKINTLAQQTAKLKDFQSTIALKKFEKELANTTNPNETESESKISTPVKGKKHSRTLGKAPNMVVALSDTVEMELILVPAGSFLMGSPPDEEGRKENENQVKVQITKPFYLGKTEVTYAQYHTIVGSSQSYSAKLADYPVTLNYREAIAFCEKLTELNHWSGRLPKNWRYTLPTEAQWEYACRAGKKSAYSFGDDKKRLHLFGNFGSHYRGIVIGGSDEDKDGYKDVAPVAQYKPNQWGFYDMHGNLAEWCIDLYRAKLQGGKDPGLQIEDEDYPYRTSSASHPAKGGTYRSCSLDVRSAYRQEESATTNTRLGFRVALIQK